MQTPSEADDPTPTAHDPSGPGLDHAARAIHPCEARKRSGALCGRYVATVWLDGLWRCPSHRPRRVKDTTAAPRLPKPPVTELRTLADVERLSSWAAMQVARGRLDHQRANALRGMCAEFRQAREAAQDDRLAGELLQVLLRYWEAQSEGDEAGMREAADEAARLIAAHRPARARPAPAPEPERPVFYDGPDEPEPSA